MNLSIIIPLYNEEELIIKVLDQLDQIKWQSIISTIEIIIVDDFSTDQSCEVVKSYINKHPHIKLFCHDVNKGKGASVRYGISKANGNTFLIQDSDLELSPSDIPRMIEAMNELSVDFINGSRYLPGVYRPLSSYKRYLANKIFTIMTSILINVKLTDMACGYKLFSKSLYEKISLKEDRFGFEAELIIKAMRIKKNNIAEVPVKYFPRNAGEGKKLKTIDGFRILKTVFKYGVLKLS